jgi:thiamine biosynthesis lipoprotein
MVVLTAKRDYHDLAFDAMGTTCSVVFEAASRARAEEFRRAVVGWVAAFEARYSRYLPDSLVSRINEAAGRAWVDVDSETEGLFAVCDWYHWLTGGVFDPSMLPIAALWDYHNPAPTLPGPDAIRRAVSLTGWKRVRREKGRVFLPEAGMGLDLGGIGKEYAVDRAVAMARRAGIANVLVNFGNDVRARGGPPEGGPWRVGLEHFASPGKCWCGVALTADAVATSGNYARRARIAGRDYGHILDPRTGYPADNEAREVSVIAPTCTEAGLLSTSIMVLGPDAGLDLLRRCRGVEGCVLGERRRWETPGFVRYVLPEDKEVAA